MSPRGASGRKPMDAAAVASELRARNGKMPQNGPNVYAKIFRPYRLLIESYTKAQGSSKK